MNYFIENELKYSFYFDLREYSRKLYIQFDKGNSSLS